MNGEELVAVRLALPYLSALLLRAFAKRGGELAVQVASEHCDPATSPEDLRPATLEAISDVATALVVRQIGEELDALERGELDVPLITAIMNRDELRPRRDRCRSRPHRRRATIEGGRPWAAELSSRGGGRVEMLRRVEGGSAQRSRAREGVPRSEKNRVRWTDA